LLVGVSTEANVSPGKRDMGIAGNAYPRVLTGYAVDNPLDLMFTLKDV
jgi:hypothetical protein